MLIFSWIIFIIYYFVHRYKSMPCFAYLSEYEFILIIADYYEISLSKAYYYYFTNQYDTVAVLSLLERK